MELTEDAKILYDALRYYCLGFKKARKRRELRSAEGFGQWKVRYLQELISELRHAGLVATSSHLGVWAVDLSPNRKYNSRAEIGAVKKSIEEHEHRAKSQLKGTSRLKRNLSLLGSGQKGFKNMEALEEWIR